MKAITVKKEELIKILRKNRAEHNGVYVEALAKFRAEMVKLFQKRLKEMRRPKGKINLNFEDIIEPQDHTQDYDTALRMLEMSVEDTIEIDYTMFVQYVEDRWPWTRQWAASNVRYSNNPKVRAFARE